jgi:hypothetical protein
MPIARDKLQKEFPALFEFFQAQHVDRLTSMVVNQLQSHYQEKNLVWSNQVSIPKWFAVCVANSSYHDFQKCIRLCLFLNHVSGSGCIKPNCTMVHKCGMCGKDGHGFSERNTKGGFKCLVWRKVDAERINFEQQFHCDVWSDQMVEKLLELTKPPSRPSSTSPRIPKKKVPQGFAALLENEDDDDDDEKVEDVAVVDSAASASTSSAAASGLATEVMTKSKQSNNTLTVPPASRKSSNPADTARSHSSSTCLQPKEKGAKKKARSTTPVRSSHSLSARDSLKDQKTSSSETVSNQVEAVAHEETVEQSRSNEDVNIIGHLEETVEQSQSNADVNIIGHLEESGESNDVFPPPPGLRIFNTLEDRWRRDESDAHSILGSSVAGTDNYTLAGSEFANRGRPLVRHLRQAEEVSVAGSEETSESIKGKSQQAGCLAGLEVKQRLKLNKKYGTNYTTAGPLLQYLLEHSLPEYTEYLQTVSPRNRAVHVSSRSQKSTIEATSETWPIGAMISDLRRGNDEKSINTLECLCVHVDFTPEWSQESVAAIEKELMLSLYKHMRQSFAARPWIDINAGRATLAFKSAEVKEVFFQTWQKFDMFVTVEPFRILMKPSSDTSAVQFQNFMRVSVTLADIQQALSKFGKVDVRRQRNLVNSNAVFTGWAQFETEQICEQFLSNLHPFSNWTESKTYQVYDICQHPIAFRQWTNIQQGYQPQAVTHTMPTNSRSVSPASCTVSKQAVSFSFEDSPSAAQQVHEGHERGEVSEMQMLDSEGPYEEMLKPEVSSSLVTAGLGCHLDQSLQTRNDPLINDDPWQRYSASSSSASVTRKASDTTQTQVSALKLPESPKPGTSKAEPSDPSSATNLLTVSSETQEQTFAQVVESLDRTVERLGQVLMESKWHKWPTGGLVCAKRVQQYVDGHGLVELEEVQNFLDEMMEKYPK